MTDAHFIFNGRNTISFINENTGWVAGYNSEIVKTTNGGQNWLLQGLGYMNPMAVQFLNENTGYITGGGGKIYKTTNGGSVWTHQNINTTLAIDKIFFQSASTGWVITKNNNFDKYVFRTTNGGTNWLQSIAFIYSLYLPYDINSFDGNNVWLTCNGGLLMKSTNSGANWSELYPKARNLFSDIYFINEDTGWVVGDSDQVRKTTDGGSNWNLLHQTTSQNPLNAVFFINQNTGWAAGYNGKFIKSTNGGYNWFALLNAPNKNLNDIYFKDDQTGWVVGDSSAFARTTDGGSIWMIYILPVICNIFEIKFINVQTGFVCGQQLVIKTTNAGVNWDILYTGPTSFYAMDFGNESTGWAIQSLYKIYKTTNSGINWVNQYNFSGPSNHFSNLKFINDQTGWAFLSEFASRTTNGGSNWTQVIFPARIQEKMFFLNESTGWLVGYTHILKTTTGGNPIDIKNISSSIPNEFILSQNYPNPFNPTTKIKFDIPPSRGARGVTKLTIYDILGREVEVLLNQELNPGTYSVTWDASNFPSGVYFYRLETDGFSEAKKIVLIK